MIKKGDIRDIGVHEKWVYTRDVTKLFLKTFANKYKIEKAWLIKSYNSSPELYGVMLEGKYNDIEFDLDCLRDMQPNILLAYVSAIHKLKAFLTWKIDNYSSKSGRISIS